VVLAVSGVGLLVAAGIVLAAVYDLRTGHTWHLGQGR
jgi:hypothetical protein